MAWVEANAFPAPGNARNPAANGFNDAECSATSFQYRRSKRGSTPQEKPTIAPPIREFLRSHPCFLFLLRNK
jgi:hypothetical protein